MEIITISRNKKTGEGSFTDGYFQIIGQNEIHTLVWPVEDRFWVPIVAKRKGCSWS
jgi:hypothetical protein